MPSFIPYRPAACLRVMGEDAAGFLQGQFTNELRQGPGWAIYGLFLNTKGKVVADAHVLKRTQNEFFVMSEHCPSETIRERLEQYIVADDVAVRDETAGVHGLAVCGAGTKEFLEQELGSVPAEGQFGQNGELLVFAGRRARTESFEMIGPENSVEALRAQLVSAGCIALTAGQAEYARIKEGVPAIPRDLGSGDLPNEGGLDTEAISYTKGCYLGQEVMARLKNLGQVRRRLFVLEGEGGAPRDQAALFQGGRKIGEIRSAATADGQCAALAMLTLLGLDRAAGVSLAPNTSPVLRIVARE
jgi:tRNA-modifying protein YgfZ